VGTYIVFTRMNTEGLRMLRDAPERLAEVEEELRALDGKIVDRWATLGQYDFCSIVSAPDNSAIHRMAVDQSAHGRSRFTVLPAIDMPLFARLLSQSTETTGPHRWQIRWYAQVGRRLLRRRTVTRHVEAACDPFRVLGMENLEGFKGPAIFIGNHSSHLDSLVLLHALPEQLKRRLAFGSAADRWFIKGRKGMTKQGWYNSLALNCFPIQRGGGSATLDYAKWLLDRKWSVMIFPEGTRSTTGKMGKFKHGVAILALEKGVPVVPVFMAGLHAIRPKGQKEAGRGPVTVRIGKPLYFEPGTAVPEATYEMFRAMEALWKAGLPGEPHGQPAEAPVREAERV
jgi:1-acyl-sn-glycerol-3-phosphate acyltransferase